MLKRFFTVFTLLLLVFGFSTMLRGNEWANYYFPDKLDSFWVYEDQNKNEVTRYAVEEEEFDGVMYRAFNYEPQLEDWANFNYYIQPYYYLVDEDWVTFLINKEYDDTIKESFEKKMEEVDAMLEEQLEEQLPALPPGVSIDISSTVEVDVQDYFYFLPTPATFNEEWTAMKIQIDITTKFEVESDNPVVQALAQESESESKTSITIIKTGVVIGTETVETEAGTFEECLKIEFHSDLEKKEEGMIGDDASEEAIRHLSEGDPEDLDEGMMEFHVGEKVATTVWLAPKVGIVKVTHKEQQAEGVMESFELTRYEIKSDKSEE